MNRLLWIPLVLAVGCSSSSPANVAGDYSVAITNEANGCNLQNWTVGSSSTGIAVTITQTNDQMDATITGVVGDYVKLILGSADFMGQVDGDGMSATLFGTTSAKNGGCEYTYDADLEGTLAGDTLTGTISYTPKTNGSPDCSSIEGCTSVQNFNGTRPPM